MALRLSRIDRMERQRREDELRNRSSKKTQEAEQPTSKRV
jgi:dynamin 1/3